MTKLSSCIRYYSNKTRRTTIRFLGIKKEQFDKNALDAFRNDIKEEIKERSSGYQNFELEVGSGNGKFLVEHAMERPDVFFIGIEYSLKAVNRSVDKAAKRDLKNLLFIYGEAVKVIEDSLYGLIDFNAVYLNFPDPWPKKKHKDRRILKTDFAKLIHKILKPGHAFYLVTDYESYAIDIMSPVMSALEEEGLYKNALGKSLVHELEGYKATLYEEKMRALGKPIFYLKYLRV